MDGMAWVAVGARVDVAERDGKGVADGAGVVITGLQADKVQAMSKNSLINQILFIFFILAMHFFDDLMF